MAKAKALYVCSDCGSQSSQWAGQCNQCGAWNSFQEETVTDQCQQGRQQRPAICQLCRQAKSRYPG